MMFDIDFSGGEIRRLPIYLLLDVSSSMAGAPIEALNRGVNLFYNELLNDSQTTGLTYVGVITFANVAQMVMPLTKLSQFTPPYLQAGGTTSLGIALDLLNQILDYDIRPQTATQQGDYKPLIFLITDGIPTDHWEGAANAIRQQTQQKMASIIALGCGSGVSINMLKRITDTVLLMDRITPEQIVQYFQWVSQAVSQASNTIKQPLNSMKNGVHLELPTLPSGFQVIL